MKRISAVFMALLLSALMLVAPITASAEYIYDGNSDKYTHTLALSDEQCETIIENAPTTNKYTNTTGSRYFGLDYAIINSTVADGETFYQPVCAYIGYQNAANQVQVNYIYARSKTEKPKIEKIDDIYTLTSDNEKEFGQIMVVYDTNTSACTNGWTHAVLDEISLVEDFENPIMTITPTYGGEYTTHIKWFTIPDYSLCPELNNVTFGGSSVICTVDPEPSMDMDISSYDSMNGFFQVLLESEDNYYHQCKIEVTDSNGNVIWRDNAQEMHYGSYGDGYELVNTFEYLGLNTEFDIGTGNYTGKALYRQFITPQQTFGYSKWHLFSCLYPYIQQYQWNDIEIQAGQTYTLNIYHVGIPKGISSEFVSLNYSNVNGKYYTYLLDDYNTASGKYDTAYLDIYELTKGEHLVTDPVELIYSRSFSFASGKAPVYNPTDDNYWTAGSNNAYSPDWQNNGYSVIVGDDGSYTPVDMEDWSYDFGIDDEIGIDDIYGLFETSSSFIAFVQAVFSCLPKFIWIIIAGGLTAVVVMRILGR